MFTIRESVPGSNLIFGLLRFWPTAISLANFRTYGLQINFLLLTTALHKHALDKCTLKAVYISLMQKSFCINHKRCNYTFVRFSSSTEGVDGAVGVLLFSSLVRSRDGHLQHLMSRICRPISSPVTLPKGQSRLQPNNIFQEDLQQRKFNWKTKFSILDNPSTFSMRCLNVRWKSLLN